MRLVSRPFRVPWTTSSMSAQVSPTSKVGAARRHNDRAMPRTVSGPYDSFDWIWAWRARALCAGWTQLDDFGLGGWRWLVTATGFKIWAETEVTHALFQAPTLCPP